MSKFRTSEPPGPAPLIWYARCPTLTAMGLIANRGVFQREFLRENVHLVSVRENSTPSVRQGHLDHSLPNLIREADAATALWAHGQNERSRLLAIGQTYHSVSVVTRPGQPINGLRDLVGRRLSLIKEAGNFSPAQVRSLRAWETVLDVAGINKSDIEFVPVVADHPSVPFGDVARREVEALLGGQSDVAILFGAKGLELARSAHLQEIHRFTAQDIRHNPRLAGLVELRAVTVDHVLLEGRGDIVTRLLGNLIEAANWASAFPKEALKQAAIEGKVELDDAATAYGDLLAEDAALGWESERLAALEALQNWLKHRHLLPEAHQIAAWADPSVLQAAQQNLSIVA
jgi:ABC-type nitrate/sulfonate/bicarbonate transport system substrate-binding protein